MKQHKQNSNVKKRIFRCANGMEYVVNEKSCLFCAHCTDLFYDYSNGPYLMFCDMENDTYKGMSGQCCWFKDDGQEPRFEE